MYINYIVIAVEKNSKCFLVKNALTGEVRAFSLGLNLGLKKKRGRKEFCGWT